MRATEHFFGLDGDTIRVVVAGDVIALPELGWSDYGYGSWISVDWLLHSAHTRLPGKSKARRRGLAECVSAALDAHHAEGAGEE